MIHSTRGIVLSHVRYGETSAIVHVYTALFGRQAYMVNGVRSLKNKGKSVLLQPLTLLQMQVYHKPGKDIQRIKEFRVEYPFVSLPFDQTKRSIAFFITELMNRSFREVEANDAMFNYIFTSVLMLDSIKGASNFHLFFLGGLTRYLGFFPDLSDYNSEMCFDLQNGVFCKSSIDHSLFISPTDTSRWYDLFSLGMEDIESFILNSDQRNKLVDALIEYYTLHLPGLGHIKSLDVLHDLYL